MKESLYLVKRYIKTKLLECDVTDVEIVNIAVYGSRAYGCALDDSDLDVVVEYKGPIREDDFFNILHEDTFMIDGIVVDINPITESKSGTLKEYLDEVKDFRKR